MGDDSNGRGFDVNGTGGRKYAEILARLRSGPKRIIENAFHAQPTTAVGYAAEIAVSRHLENRGAHVVRVAHIAEDTPGAPLLHGAGAYTWLPDLLVFGGPLHPGPHWVEVKAKTGPAYNRQRGALCHGIDGDSFDAYGRVESRTGLPVYLAVVETTGAPGSLLVARFSDLDTWGCTCRACKADDPRGCVATVKRGVYMRRDQLKYAGHVRVEGEHGTK